MQRMRTFLAAGLLGAVSLGGMAPRAAATQIISQPLEVMNARSAMVVRAVPIAGTSRSRWTEPNNQGLILTVTRFRVIETLAADRAVGGEIDVQTLGGTIGDITMKVPGGAGFVPDEEVVLFLDDSLSGVPMILDLSAGKFEVAPDGRGEARLTRRDFEDVVVAGGPAPRQPATLREMREAVAACRGLRAEYLRTGRLPDGAPGADAKPQPNNAKEAE